MLTATNSSKIDISKEKTTKFIAELFAKNLKDQSTLFLYGEIGVGKTTFVKFLINFLQKNFNKTLTEIPSPTFNIVNEYEINNIIIQHYDLYRIKDKKEIFNLGILENINYQIRIIEWPGLLEEFKIKNIFNLKFEYDEDMKKRFLTVSPNPNNNFLDELK